MAMNNPFVRRRAAPTFPLPSFSSLIPRRPRKSSTTTVSEQPEEVDTHKFYPSTAPPRRPALKRASISESVDASRRDSVGSEFSSDSDQSSCAQFNVELTPVDDDEDTVSTISESFKTKLAKGIVRVKLVFCSTKPGQHRHPRPRRAIPLMPQLSGPAPSLHLANARVDSQYDHAGIDDDMDGRVRFVVHSKWKLEEEVAREVNREPTWAEY
ncbi:hypothetical protein C8F01DRAFT_1259509 [Mycena amicta]|nr:hypothetical protein C8F01DRAFT_1259509 [Mycena amicta]